MKLECETLPQISIILVQLLPPMYNKPFFEKEAGTQDSGR